MNLQHDGNEFICTGVYRGHRFLTFAPSRKEAMAYAIELMSKWEGNGKIFNNLRCELWLHEPDERGPV